MTPYIIYKGSKLQKYEEVYDRWKGWNGAYYSQSPNGWMTTQNFLEWLEKVFVPQAKKYAPPGYRGQIFLYVDGHSTHTTPEVVEFCVKNHITLLCFPAHATHVLQPLDRSVFKPAKNIWNEKLRLFHNENSRAVYFNLHIINLEISTIDYSFR
jgi:hypothetical protein